MATVVQVREKGAQPIELYVHYEGYDRRLDEWVNMDRVDMTAFAKSLRDENGNGDGDGAAQRKLTRNMKRRHDELHVQRYHDESDPTLAALEREHEKVTKVKYINQIYFGEYCMDSWYFSPYPDEYAKCRRLYVCEWCFKYMAHIKSLKEHKCDARQPPGQEIYRQRNLSVYEVDGQHHKLYCQNLCLLAKVFLDHKTLYFDVEPFLFYILTEVDEHGAHFVGYFSKEKNCQEGNNLACICVLPPHQRKGYGRLLIEISYALSKREGILGSPEKPLSDLGKIGYRSYWSWVLLNALQGHKGSVSLADLSRKTWLTPEDILSTLHYLDMVHFAKAEFRLHVTAEMVETLLNSSKYRRPKAPFNEKCLRWAPRITEKISPAES